MLESGPLAGFQRVSLRTEPAGSKRLILSASETGPRAALGPVGSQALEDFATLVVEDPEPNRAPRPIRIGGGADRGGGVFRLDFAFENDRGAAIAGDAKELKPEPSRSRSENAVQFVQRDLSRKKEPTPWRAETQAAPALGRTARSAGGYADRIVFHDWTS